jgi:hypothetical protein
MSELNKPREEPRPACRDFDRHLAAYLEGEAQPAVDRHARECPYCRVVLEDLRAIREASSELPLPEPPARLWANIRATLEAEGVIRLQPSFWQRWFPVARLAPEARPVGALLGLAALALVMVTSTGNLDSTRPKHIMPGAGVVTAAGLSPALEATVRQMEEAFRAQEDSFEPELKTTYRKSLEALDDSIRETMIQCQRDPADPLAQQFLLNAYRTKAEVLAAALETSP